MNSCSPVWQYICSFSKYSMEVLSANSFALLDRYRDTSLIYLLTPNPNTTRRYFFVPPKTLLQSCTSMGLFLGLLLGFLAFRKKGFFDIIQAFCRTYVNESSVHFGNCTWGRQHKLEWHTSKFQQNMYVLVLLAQSDASVIFEKDLWTCTSLCQY